MERRILRYGGILAAVGFAIVALTASPGCKSLMTTVAMIATGGEGPVEYPGLKDKKVVVVVRPPMSLQYQNSTAARDLAIQIGVLLDKNGRKINVIDQQKVSAWTDENDWQEFTQVGKALGADMVVGVDLTSFSTLQGQTLYRGQAAATLKVYDLKQDNKVVFEKSLPHVLYPANMSLPAADKTEGEFRHEFIMVLAEQIGRHFYGHDPNDDIGQDSRAGL